MVTKRKDEGHARPKLFSLVLLAENTLGESVPIRVMTLVMREDKFTSDIIREGVLKLLQRHIPDALLNSIVDAILCGHTVALGIGDISLDTGQIMTIIWRDSEELRKSAVHNPELAPRIYEDILITKL